MSRRYGTDDIAALRAALVAEQLARQARRGLWALPEAQRTPPWEWRAAERAGQQGRPASLAPAASSPATGGFTCGGKRYCRGMMSCAEARFYLSQCALSRLDGDGDGVPCESLCR